VAQFITLPPPSKLRFEDDELILRPPEASDAMALFEMMTDERMEYVTYNNRQASVEQLQDGVARFQASAQNNPQQIHWVHEVEGRAVGLAMVRLRHLDVNGGTWCDTSTSSC
jgi:RimJ/RimL family protein N-acetyltransferase